MGAENSGVWGCQTWFFRTGTGPEARTQGSQIGLWAADRGHQSSRDGRKLWSELRMGCADREGPRTAPGTSKPRGQVTTGCWLWEQTLRDPENTAR